MAKPIDQQIEFMKEVWRKYCELNEILTIGGDNLDSFDEEHATILRYLRISIPYLYIAAKLNHNALIELTSAITEIGMKHNLTDFARENLQTILNINDNSCFATVLSKSEH